MKQGIDLIDHFAEMVLVIREIVMVGFDNQDLSQVVRFHPGFVPFVQPFKVIDPYRAFIFTSAFLDLVDKRLDRSPEVQKKIRRLDKRAHQPEEL